MNQIKSIGTFIQRGNELLRSTNPEGYVAVDRLGRAVKLVDRLEFSTANVSYKGKRTFRVSNKNSYCYKKEINQHIKNI